MSDAYSILIIDDDAVVLRVLAARLGIRDGHDVRVAKDGSTGIAMAIEKRPDLILLDWMMPRMTGLVVLEALKGDSRTAWIPVYMLTGRKKMKDVEKALAKGASGYFTKPVNLADLSKRVRHVLQKGEEQNETTMDNFDQ